MFVLPLILRFNQTFKNIKILIEVASWNITIGVFGVKPRAQLHFE